MRMLKSGGSYDCHFGKPIYFCIELRGYCGWSHFYNGFFQFVGPSGVLLYRYYIMQLLAIGRDEDEDLKDSLSEEDMADAIAETNIFATHAVSMAATDYTEPTSKDDLKINYSGTVDEFRDEITYGVVVALSRSFEHEFLDFSDATGMSRIEYKCAVAAFMGAVEADEGKVSDFFTIEPAK